ncbi:MAG: YjjW family glycine radical enzyme activase [Erysipelotrichaceae bacterium]
MRAPINKIFEVSTVDGPGSRMSIFFQGCHFNCLYCHNPETINLCNNCGICVAGCPSGALTISEGIVEYNQEICINCDACIKVCPYDSSPKINWLEVDELVNIVQRYQPLIRGITVSGGECMLYAAYLLELFKKVKALGLSCLIDTNGGVDFQNHSELLEYTDGVMLDVKASDQNFHQKIIGVDNKLVLKNLDYLINQNKLYEVRTVLLPNQLTQNKKTIEYLCQILPNEIRYKLIAYRPYGVRELAKIKLGAQSLSKNELSEYAKYANSLGHNNVVTI